MLRAQRPRGRERAGWGHTARLLEDGGSGGPPGCTAANTAGKACSWGGQKGSGEVGEGRKGESSAGPGPPLAAESLTESIHLSCLTRASQADPGLLMQALLARPLHSLHLMLTTLLPLHLPRGHFPLHPLSHQPLNFALSLQFQA